MTISLAEASPYPQLSEKSTSSITIQNNTALPLFLLQAGARDDPSIAQDEFTLFSAPKSTVSFGFILLTALKPKEQGISGEATTERNGTHLKTCVSDVHCVLFVDRNASLFSFSFSLAGLFHSVHYQQMAIGYTTNTSAENVLMNLPQLPSDMSYFDTKLDLMQVDKKYSLHETAFGVNIQLEVYFCLSTYLSIYLSIYMYVCMYVCKYVCE